MVLDELIDAVTDITVPVCLFFGGADPSISGDCIQQIEARFQELGKDYTLRIYPDAGHGFFCHEGLTITIWQRKMLGSNFYDSSINICRKGKLTVTFS